MKILLLIFVALVNFTSYSQSKQGITITVHLKGLEDGRKYYLNTPFKVGVDSSVSKNEKLLFRFIGEPNRLNISSSADNGGDGNQGYHSIASFWSDANNISIRGHLDSLENIKIDGPKISIILAHLEKQVVPLMEQRDDARMKQNLIKQESINQNIKSIYTKFIKENNNSYPGLIILSYVTLDKTLTAQEANELLRTRFTGMTNSEYYSAVQKITSNADNLKIGSVAPDFTQNNIDGKPVKLSDFRGKYVLIEFGASWCGPCRSENPYLVSAYEQYKEKGFEIIGVSLDMNKNTWKKTIEKDKLTWIQVSDLKGWHNEVALLYGVAGIPQNFLLNTKGEIVATDLRMNFLEEKLKELIK